MEVDDIRAEISRLRSGPLQNQIPNGLGTVRFLAQCLNDAESVLERARTVLLQLLEAMVQGETDYSDLRCRLPNWFVISSDLSTKQLPFQISISEECRWDLEGWLGWFTLLDDGRSWNWWDAIVVDDLIIVAVVTREWPFPIGALEWLFVAAGASSFLPEP